MELGCLIVGSYSDPSEIGRANLVSESKGLTLSSGNFLQTVPMVPRHMMRALLGLLWSSKWRHSRSKQLWVRSASGMSFL
jgi:hypothetical protein